mgnify:CR=1 FL=1
MTTTMQAAIAKNPRWVVVDVQLKRRLKRVITLDELREHADARTRWDAAVETRQQTVDHAGE